MTNVTERREMYFKSLTITNFKSFRGTKEVLFSNGLNYIVGDNNCGKSTIVDALRYLVEGSRDITALQNKASVEAFSVETAFAGDELRQIVEDKKYAKYKEYLNDENNEAYFRVRRSTEEKTIEQNDKPVKLNGKKITFWNTKTDQFENPSGIDALFKSLVDIVPVFADTTTTDVVDFGATKTLGKLIAATSSEFQTTDKWRAFQNAHTAAFSTGDNSFVSLTRDMTSQIEALVREQYGPAEVRLDFNLPDAATFIKGGQLLVKDGSYETPLTDKGTGIQRAVTLALIQVYSQLQHEAKEHAPLTLLLDEPETWLHPRAQLQLSEALVTIAETEQLFLITHSS